MKSSNAIEQFRDAIEAKGLTPPAAIVPDGTLHRFASNGTSGDDAGWYVLYGDNIPAGAFGCWRAGVNEHWRADIGRSLTPAEQIAHLAKVQAMSKMREGDEARRQQAVKADATEIWKQATPASDEYVYLVRKHVKAYGLRIHQGRLVVPMHANGELHCLQFIGKRGNKRFLPGGRIRGCYFGIGDINCTETLCITEGYATGATVHEATGYPVVVAFTACNLEPVAVALRERYPNLTLIICADDDAATDGNLGLSKATEAARAALGLVAVPNFQTNRPSGATDFNDLAAHGGLEAVNRDITKANAPSKARIPPTADNAPTAILVRASDIEPEAIEWLWRGWLAAGKLHILAGAPSTGKTTIALYMAAVLSLGALWPDGTRAALANSLIWSGEDSDADTLIPRLQAMGADLTRIHFVRGVADEKGARPFDPATDMKALSRAAAALPALRFLLIDPMVSAVRGDSHKNAEVRRDLQPVVDFCAKYRCAGVGISHFTKNTAGRNPLDRVTGSLGFGALPRMVYGTAKTEREGGEQRVFVRVKNNLGPDEGGFSYAVEVADLGQGIAGSRIVWGGPIDGDARTILGNAERRNDDKGTARDEVAEWLREVLAAGPVSGGAVKSLANEAGYSWRTVQRAREAIGAEAGRLGFGGGSLWNLPIRDSGPHSRQQEVVSRMDDRGGNGENATLAEVEI